MKESFKRNLIVSYGLSLFLVIISSIASYMSIHNLLESQSLVDHTNSVIKRLERVISVLKDGETGQRGYLLTGRPEFLEPYNGARDEALRLIDEVEELTLDNPAQQRSLEELRSTTTQRFAQLQDIIDAKKTRCGAHRRRLEPWPGTDGCYPPPGTGNAGPGTGPAATAYR